MECCLECDLDMANAVLEDEKDQYLLALPAGYNHNDGDSTSEDLDASAETATNEDCFLCLEPMHPSDVLVPLLCPQEGCTFNYCTQCVWNLLLTSSQPYQEASDGSLQLKVKLQCPQCRTPYPHRQVVNDIVLLRQACRLQKLFFGDKAANESALKASELATKQAFLEQVTWEALKESWVRVDKYLKDHGKVQLMLQQQQLNAASNNNNNNNNNNISSNDNYNDITVTSPKNSDNSNHNNIISSPTNTIPKLPAQWKDILLHQPASKNATEENDLYMGMGQAQYTLVDPTLFRGMEESMTLDEQQFLSELLVSGSVPNLTQAAQIMHGMLQLLMQGGLRNRQPSSMAWSFSNLSADNNNTNNNNNNNNDNKYGYTRAKKKKNFRLLTTGTHLLYPDLDLAFLKKRFPLPLMMPRWIVLPVYNPNKRGAPLSLKDHKWGLEIVSVRGAAGQQGLRKGDVVTHINEESCEHSNVVEYTSYMTTLYELKTQSSVSLVVNAHPEAAQALQQRSYEMIHFLTEREKEKEHRFAASRGVAVEISRSSDATTTSEDRDGDDTSNSHEPPIIQNTFSSGAGSARSASRKNGGH